MAQKQRRAFSNYPEFLKTQQNNRETAIADDPLYEPEQSKFINGFIGDVSVLTDEDLERTPQLEELDPERQAQQLTIGATFINPDTLERESASFFSDLVGQISANGGIVDDQNRVFSVSFYAWNPPIDFDKHINFGRYLWTGAGEADLQGEYITKEPAHSKTTIYEFDGTEFVKRDVTVEKSLPAVGPAGTFVEDASTQDRFIYRSDGTSWLLVDFDTVDDIPEDTTDFVTGDFIYITRTAPIEDFNRPLVWFYSDEAGRWISQPVVVRKTEPDLPREGMVWEDARVPPRRRLKIFQSGVFVDLSFTAEDGPQGAPGAPGEYIYDTRDFSELTDDWSRLNLWRHHEDLSPVDRENRTSSDQAIRPILEFWEGIDGVAGDVRDARNDFPVFRKFAFDLGTDSIIDTGEGTTIFQYQVQTTGDDDLVLGFPVTFNQSGEFLFELTLESDSSDFEGYKYFRDKNTGFLHSVWTKADEKTLQTQDADGVWSLPENLRSNPNHEVLTEGSRSKFLNHMAGVISSQENFQGTQFGRNNWRWTKKDPTVGATIIDPEQSLLRAQALLQRSNLSMPDAIRSMAREYNKVLFRFVNKLNQLWDNGEISDQGSDTLVVSAGEAVDIILTQLFIGRTQDFPFFFSDMGTYTETRIDAGIPTVIDPDPRPIFIAPSPARLGASPCFDPESFIDPDGLTKLRGHEGVIIESFGDERDLVWLELQSRFFAAVPEELCTETDTFSARFTDSNFFLDDFFGNFAPSTPIQPVQDVVDDFNTIVSPSAGMRVFSTDQGVFAFFDGNVWLTTSARTDDIFLNETTEQFWIFNGLGAFVIDDWNRPFDFDYSSNEFRRIIRREFERFILFKEQDFTENITFDVNDPFTWNFRSAGVEGHYRGIYRRVYNTVRPHSHPWEVMGYKIEPTWWRTQYVPTSTEADGTPRYADTHPMWADFQAGIVAHPSGDIQRDQFILTGPIPVDSNGNLQDPIEAGVVDAAKLDTQRIDDFWQYGDGAPVEQEWVDSPFYPFAIALAGFLMKNGVWLDTLWTQLYISIGEGQLFRAPHVVHQDTLTRPALGVLPVHLESDSDGDPQPRLGTNAWISEALQIAGASPDEDFGTVMRNTSPALIWRTSGFINKDRTVVSTLSAEEIPFEDLHVILHQSQPTSQKFISGMVVVREQPSGFRIFGFDAFNPFFRVERPAIPIFGGQVELRQEFTVDFIDDDAGLVTGGSVFPNKEVRRTFEVTNFRLPRGSGDTAKFSVLVNGVKIKDQHVRLVDDNSVQIESLIELEPGDIITVSAITNQSNPSTMTKQFTVDGVQFPYFASGSGVFEDIEYGRFFANATDVVNFMIGYGRALVQEGWILDDISEGGEERDWLLGAKRFAKWNLDVTSSRADSTVDILDEDMFFYSPVQNVAKFEAPFGQTTNVESIMNGAFGIVNRRSEPIPTEETFVSRVDEQLIVERVNRGNPESEIFGLRVNVVEHQHVVVFSNVTRFNDLIYDPVIALSHETLRVDSLRTPIDWRGRLEAPGFIISGGELLPNFEKQAFDLVRLYDRFNPPDDPELRDQARNLYNFSPPRVSEYMDPVRAADRTKFDYHRGMIQSKGTVRPIQAFVRGTTIGTENVFINEDWAWKVQTGGDTRISQVQFRVNKSDLSSETTVVQFGGPVTAGDKIFEVEDFDRSNPADNAVWIRPPTVCKSLSDTNCNLEFEENISGLPLVDGIRYFVKIFDAETLITQLSLTHFDPDVDKFDSAARAELDFEQYVDPARYTNGPKAAFSAELSWGEEQTNKLWWNVQRSRHIDYRSLIPDYEKAAAQWGRLEFFRANVTRTDEVATIETLDPFGSGTVVAHGFTVGDEIIVSIRNADQSDWNVTEQAVTVTSATEFQFTIDTAPATPATGPVEVVTGAIDIFEWIESPVPPEEYADFVANSSDPDIPNGAVLNINTSEGPSWVEREVNGETRFFFWVRNSSAPVFGKDFTPQQLSARLSNPVAAGVPFFAPVDSEHMVVFTGATRVQDGWAIEVTIDERELESHVEWILVSEGSRFIAVPDVIVNKLIDSMSGEDAFGNPVPAPTLIEGERFGSCDFPPQTVFADVDSAVSVYVEALNKIFRRKNLSEVDILTAIFTLADELSDANPDGFWQRTEFIEEEFEDKPIFETVATISERDRRADAQFYAPGDLVKVKESGETDPWTGAEVAATFVFTEDELFVQVGLDNNTVAINSNIALDTANFRSIFDRTFNVLTRFEQNSLVFSLLNEMLLQNQNVDWFFKTSYITAQIFTESNDSPFVRPNEEAAIVSNILDVKPFRTKLRTIANQIGIRGQEDFATQIIEFPDKKISLIFDRLSCNLIDDCGWDADGWDATDPVDFPCVTWDKPLWDLENLGRDEFYVVGSVAGDGATTEFTVTPFFDPTLYGVEVVLKRTSTGEEVTLAGFEVTIFKSPTEIRLVTNFPVPSQFELEVRQAMGFFEGTEPFLGGTLADTLFQPAPNDYKHFVARTLRLGEDFFDPRTVMDGCTDPNDPLGGRPEERFVVDIENDANICVINDHSPALAGWDMTPWDTGATWDLAPPNVGRRVFFVIVGEQGPDIAPGTEMFPTSEVLTPVESPLLDNEAPQEPRFIISTNPASFNIAQVELKRFGDPDFLPVTEGVEFRKADEFKHIHVLEFLRPEPETFTADGATTSFQTTFGPKVDEVFVNGMKQVAGVDYNLDITQTRVDFIQPPNTVITNFARPPSTSLGMSNTGDGFNDEFETDLDRASLNVDNAFIFSNKDLLPTTDYTIGTGSELDFKLSSVPLLGDEVLIFPLGNDIANPLSLFNIDTFTASPAQTTFNLSSGGFGTKDRTFVFVNGRYQHFGGANDYTHPLTDQVEFNTPLAGGETVEIRVLKSPVVDVEHITFTTSGGTQDPIPGLFDADNTLTYMLFLEDEIQDGYTTAGSPDFSIVSGTPDEIKWTVTPGAGEKVSLRMIRKARVTDTVVVNVFPLADSEVLVTARNFIAPTDEVRLRFNGWPVETLGDFKVLATPPSGGQYDVVNGVLSFENLPDPGEMVNIEFTITRKGDMPRSLVVRTDLIVHELLENHLVYDEPLGFETDRPVGRQVINTTSARIFEWDGSVWNDVGAVPVGQPFLSYRDQEIWEWDGASFNKLWSVGEVFTNPPVLGLPAFGRGIRSATYSYGQASDAATEYPDAFQVIQHPGDCPE